MTDIEVRHDAEQRRFVATVEGHDTYLDYKVVDDRTVDFVHTFSPPELRGRGLAGIVVRAALEWARGSGKTVIPTCSYVVRVVEKQKGETA